VAFVARAAAPGSPGIKKVSIKHEAILNFLLAHPLVKLRDVAKHFEVSQPWLSNVIHSDAFQRQLRLRQDIHFDASILPIMERMQLVAEKAVDKLLEEIPFESDVAKLNQVVDKTLTRLGYGTSVPSTQVNVQVNVEATALDRARQLIGARRQPALEVGGDAVGDATAIQAGSGSAMGKAHPAPAVYAEASQDAT
jgi:hypothetical protein